VSRVGNERQQALRGIVLAWVPFARLVDVLLVLEPSPAIVVKRALDEAAARQHRFAGALPTSRDLALCVVMAGPSRRDWRPARS